MQRGSEDAIRAMKWNRVVEMPLMLSTMFTRLSIGLSLYRIFAVKEISKGIILPLMVLNVVINLAKITIVLLQCSPFPKLWNPDIAGRCWSGTFQLGVSIFQGGMSEAPRIVSRCLTSVSAVSAFIDFVLALLPIVFLWNVQMKKNMKIGICILMGLGFL